MASAMDSTRAGTPTRTAMDIDVEFEEEETIDSPQPMHASTTTRPSNALSKLMESDSEDDDIPARAPRRPLLARLKPESPAEDAEDASDSEDDNGASAYERIRKQLMSAPTEQEPEKKPIAALPSVVASDSEDDDIPVRTTGRRPVQRRTSTSPPASPSPSIHARSSSPGLFVSPNPSPAANRTSRRFSPLGSDSNSPTRRRDNSDLEERVRRIRKERLAREQREQSNSKSTKSRTHTNSDSDSDPDGEIGNKLTQQTRPARKAGKKALEEMARDQQRIKRNMQLTHQAKTKKKYGVKDLFTKFGLNSGNEAPAPAALLTPDASSVVASSDAEAQHAHYTPPTSPPVPEDTEMKDAPADKESISKELPTKLDKGKGRAPEYQHLPQNPLVDRSRPLTVHNASVNEMILLSDSDDDLEIVESRSRFPVFDRLPQRKQQEGSSLLHLRHLAHLTSPSKRAPKGKKSMNLVELQMMLNQKARQQAQKEREEKIAELKKRGIHIETQEEREKHQMEIESLAEQFEKQRQEDLKLAKMERDEAKKNGEVGDGLLSSDESEDEDYVGSGEENADEEEEEEEVEIELSGSEDEDADNDEDLEDDAADKPNALVDEMADEDDEAEADQPTAQTIAADADEDMEDEVVAPVRQRTTTRARNVVLDDEDESGDEAPANSPTQQATQDDAMAAFGFDNPPSSLGLTQMFAGTMANLQSEPQVAPQPAIEQEQDSLDFLRSLPDTQPNVNFSQASEMLIPNSQTQASQSGPASQIDLGISQLVETSPAFSRTQYSDMPEPTQDAGFQLSRSPRGFARPTSTVETVLLTESPIAKKKGRLHRGRKDAPAEFSDVEEGLAESDADEQPVRKAKDVFSVMKKASKKKQAIDNFNKKTSWARDAIQEQAEESEDEYAGIGGASDDDSGEEDEELAKMIDSNDVKVDERKIAAFYAERAKAEDEKNINQLYKDVMNGGLRKRAGRDAFDMSDSEDEAETRRRKKQMQFKQMTKALISDERIGKMYQNPKTSAFFNSLADHIMEDPDYEFLDAPDAATEQPSQSQSDEPAEAAEDVTVPNSQTESPEPAPVPNPLKRKAPESQDKENRPPAHLRRTAPSDGIARKPMTIADVQHSVSELLEDPRIQVPASQYSDSESENEAAPKKPVARKPIIDRLTLSRTSTVSEAGADAGNMAFHAAPAGPHVPGFKVPSLVRRATSNFSITSERSSSGATTPSEGVRRGGTGKSNIHAQAREAERRAVLEKAEMKRKANIKQKVTKAKVTRSVLRDLGGGFE